MGVAIVAKGMWGREASHLSPEGRGVASERDIIMEGSCENIDSEA